MLLRFLPALCLLVVSCSRGGQVEAVVVESKALADNPLGDSPQRRVAVFSPAGASHGEPLPMVVYLPGWGGSSEGYLAPGGGEAFSALVDEFAHDGKPLRIAVVDGRSRYGGSQFLNSTATGRYEDFVTQDVLHSLDTDFASPTGHRWIAGHSSGGYGALRLAMDHPELFSAVVGLSPDSDFEVTHKPLVQQPSVQALSPADVSAAMAVGPAHRLPADGLARLIVGLCANYTGVGPKQPAQFSWLYDGTGAWRPDVWQLWIDADPFTIVQRKADAFSPKQAVYLDGAQFDEFGANIGARKIYEVLRDRPAPVTFYEAPGHHGDRIPERLGRGLRWVLEQGR